MLSTQLTIAKNLLLNSALSPKAKLTLLKRLYAYKKHSTGRTVIFDISHVCNGRCYFCQTGFANRNNTPCKSQSGKQFVEVDFFHKILKHLKEQNFLNDGTQLHLFNWFEPLLHPEFASIIKTATQENCLIGLSTNANVLPKLPSDFDASRVVLLIFSMCGFSQQSYDKIHQFDFEHIKHNVERIVKDFRNHGCVGEMYISFHLYQFNLHELQAAYEWAKQLHINICPAFAYINDGPRLLQFFKKELSMDYLQEVSNSLFMGMYTKIFHPTTSCPLMNDITIEMDGQCDLCCGLDEKIGNVFDMTPEKLARIHYESPTCKECMALGIPCLERGVHCNMQQLANAFHQ